MKLLGQRLSTRHFDRKAANLQIRVAALNDFTALGTPITHVTGEVFPWKAELQTPTYLCNRTAHHH